MLKGIQNKQSIKTLLLSILIGMWANCYGQNQNEYFKKLPEELGLNNTTVTSIVQDQKGYIWFGTWVGLYRYDGQKTKLYKVEQNSPNSIQSNKIASLLISKEGDLYIGTQVGGAYKYRYEYDDFVSLNEKTTSVMRSSIWSLFEDRYHNIWAGTEKGIAILDKKLQVFKNNDGFLKSEVNSRRVQQVTDCNSEYIWVSTDEGVFCFLSEKNGNITEMGKYSFLLENYTGEQSSFISQVIAAPGKEGKILALCKSGLVELDYSNGFKKTSYKLLQPASLSFNFPRVIIQSRWFPDGYLIGANSGLNKISLDGKSLQNQFLKGNVIRSIYEDNFGTLWVGTEYGLQKFNRSESFITTNVIQDSKIQLDVLEYLCRSPRSGDVWMAWQNGTISRMRNGDVKKLTHYKIKLNGNIIRERLSQIAIDEDGTVFVGSQGLGLIKFSEAKVVEGSEIVATQELNNQNGLNDNYVMSVANVGDHLWLGTWNTGLYKYNKKSKIIKKYGTIDGLDYDLKEVPIVEISELIKQHKIVLGTRGAGIVIADIDENYDLVNPLHINSKGKLKSLSNDFVTNIYADDEMVLICSEGGLDQYNIATGEIGSFLIDDQMVKSIMQAVIKSENNHYWVSTYNNGLIEIDKSSKRIKYKNYSKNVLTNYSGSAAIVINKNLLLFGGAQGFSTLAIDNKEVNITAPIPFITDLKINNKSVSPGENINGDQKFDKVISSLPVVNLNYKDNAFSLSLNAIQTADAQSLKYAYKLDGFNDDWIYASEDEKQVYFTNLPFKSYKFKFKAANSDGVWSEEAVLPITISPPWWQSNLAYFVYTILGFGIVYLIILGLVMKEQYDHQIQLEKIERAKIEEIIQMKLKFYTSISHELRTPLTMIISPLEQLINNKGEVDEKQSHHFMMKNAKKLLAMVNQLLDFRKHESGVLALNLRKQDLAAFSKECLSSFDILAKDKNIGLRFQCDDGKIVMVFDEDQIDKLLNNLIGNAIKYTPKNGVISLSISKNASNEMATIEVTDTGVGIDAEDIDRIFERFYQGKDHAQSGYGLGLSIVKSIVDLHQGSLQVNSTKGQGSKFIVNIPMTLDENIISNSAENRHDLEYTQLFRDIEEEGHPDSDLSHKEEVGDEKKILVVEDNDEIRSYIKQNFSKSFIVLEACNGIDGLELALKEMPDLIISDIAMPGMDGLELCKEIKSKIVTSHIPVILLTARTSVEYKLAGYEFGANAYVTKPFNMELLKQQVNSLLEFREILKQKYGKAVSKTHFVYEPEKPEEQSLDDEFMKKIIVIIEENMSEANFTVDDMAKLLLMSRIQVYRKVKALTGQTPNNFLREIRLKRAAQLLELTDFSISEVTYKVGFNDLKYFREKFKEEYGLNPSDFRGANKIASNN